MSKNESPGPGRPELPKGEAKDKLTGFRAKASERAEIDRAAEIAGLRLSDWLRKQVLSAARREIKRADGGKRR